jgi:Tfp pilus assembly protein PilX
MRIPRAKSESGVAVIVALSVLTILLLLAGVILSSTVNLGDASKRDAMSKRAFEAAQAGLQTTLYRLNMNINSSGGEAATLNSKCIGGENELVEEPLPTTPGVCKPYTSGTGATSLGNGASFKSWTSTVFVGSGECAGEIVGESSSVAQRCVTSQGIVRQGGREAKQRVQERVVSFDGRPLFEHAGVTAESAIILGNTAEVLGALYAKNEIVVQNPKPKAEAYALASGGKTVVESGASVAQLGKNLGEIKEWRSSPALPPVQPIPLGGPVYTFPDGNARISNAFTTCTGACEAPDSFYKDNKPKEGCTAIACGWEGATRSLKLPSGYTWELSGGTYNLCNLIINGTAKLTFKKHTVIFIDSPSDPETKCPANSGHLEISGGFVNNTPGETCSPAPCTPLTFDTTALQIYVYGPSDVPNSNATKNACLTGSDLTCVRISGAGEFWGTVFAPTSDVAVLNKGLTAGAIVGATVTFNNPGKFEQDHQDETITTTAKGTYYRSAWHQCKSEAPSATKPMADC